MSYNPIAKQSKTNIQIKWMGLDIKVTTTSIIVAIALGSLVLLFGVGIYVVGQRAHDTDKSEAKSTESASAPTLISSGTAPTVRGLSSAPTSSAAVSASSAALAASAPGAASDSDDAIKQNEDGLYNQNHVDIKKSKLQPGTRTPSITQEMKGSHNVNSVVVE